MSTRIHARGHAVKGLHLPNRCFACGPANPEGMRLKFYFDDSTRRAYCKFRLGRRYQGPPGHAHGGIIATILDEAMGKVNKFRSVVALTKQIDIRYRRPVPLGQSLIAEGHERRVRGRVHVNVGEIRNQKGEVLASGRGVFIAIDPERLFARHIGMKRPVKRVVK